jgi:HEAT repeat protein
VFNRVHGFRIFLVSHAAIIAPKSRHDDFLALKEKDPHLDFELYTLEEMEDLFAYHYDERALERLYPEVKDEEKCEAMLKALAHLKLEKQYPSAKLEALKPIQETLLNEGLLYRTPNPERSFEGRSVVISGYQNTLRISAIIR